MHILRPEHAALAQRFATRGADKFADSFAPGPHGLPVLDRASVTLECRPHARYPAGDHTVLIGHVTQAQSDGSSPAVYFRREFHAIPEAR